MAKQIHWHFSLTYKFQRWYILNHTKHSLPVLKYKTNMQTKLSIKSIIFWDVTPCSLLRCNQRFEGTYRLHLQGRRKYFSKNHLLTCWFLLKFFLRPWRWRRYVPPKRRLHLNRLHGVTSEKMILFITTAVKTSNPTKLSISYTVPSLFIFHRNRRRGQDSSVSIGTSLEPGWPRNRASISEGIGHLSLLHSAKTGSGAHLASYPMGTVGLPLEGLSPRRGERA
jgi:hypothetical protein